MTKQPSRNAQQPAWVWWVMIPCLWLAAVLIPLPGMLPGALGGSIWAVWMGIRATRLAKAARLADQQAASPPVV